MGLVELLILIAVVGFVVYLLVTLVPMPAPFQTAIIGIAILVVVLVLLRIIGFDMQIPHVR